MADMWRCEETARGAALKRGHRRPDASTLQSGIRSRRGRRAILTQRKRNWDPKPDRPRAQGGAAVVPMLTGVSRSQSVYIWMAEQAQSGALPPHHGAEPAPRALGPVTPLP
jgi:hypothetical protein